MQTRRPALSDLVACAEREFALRKRVYTNWVRHHRIGAHKAAWEIACMTLIRDRLAHELCSTQPELKFRPPD